MHRLGEVGVVGLGGYAVEGGVDTDEFERGVARFLPEHLLPRPRLLSVSPDDEVVSPLVAVRERDVDARLVLRELRHGLPELVCDPALAPRLLALLHALLVKEVDDVPPHDLVLAREALPALSRGVRLHRGVPLAVPVVHLEAALAHGLSLDGVEEPKLSHHRDPLGPEIDLLPVGAQLGVALYHSDLVVRVGFQQEKSASRPTDAGAYDENVERHDEISLSLV